MLKRPKAAKACDLCKHKKIRCDPSTHPCANCLSSGKECTFNYVEKQRRTPVRSAKRIDALEKRLKLVEELLRESKAAAAPPLPAPAAPLALDAPPPAPQSLLQAPPLTAQDEFEKTVSDFFPMSMDLLEPPGATGPANATLMPGAPPPAPPAVSAVDINQVSTLPPDIWWPSPDRLATLPPLKEVIPVISHYFTAYNNAFPIIDEAYFTQFISENYQTTCQNDTAWWAMINIMLAFVYRLPIGKTLTTYDKRKGTMYLQNALSALPTLISSDPTLLHIQTLLLIAIVIQASSNPRPGSVIVASAIRLAQVMGLHRATPYEPLTRREMVQRQRVFWAAYFFDKDFSLRINSPPILHDVDISVPLPSEVPEDGLGIIYTIDGTSKINFFRRLVDLSIIGNQIYHRLYSASALKCSEADRVVAEDRLSSRLQTVYASIPPAFKPDAIQHTLGDAQRLHLIVMHLSYFNHASLARGTSISNDAWTKALTPVSNSQPLETSVEPPKPCCLNMARSIAKLVALIPQGDHALAWLLIYYYMSAVTILLSNVILNEAESQMDSDLELARPMVKLISGLVRGDKETAELRRLRNLCSGLHQQATESVERRFLASAPYVDGPEMYPLNSYWS